MKPYSCDICSKTYATSSLLKEHERRAHTGVRPNSCDLCNFAFFNNTELKEHHMRIHTRERPFSCDECNRCFIRKDELKLHKRWHAGDTSYNCDFCESVIRVL